MYRVVVVLHTQRRFEVPIAGGAVMVVFLQVVVVLDVGREVMSFGTPVAYVVA